MLLSGLRVLDLTDDRGALGPKLLADLGADVVKVEPLGGCATRRISPFLDGRPGADRSLYFQAFQSGKRSVTLNLDAADGRAVLGDLASTADFLVESFGPGYLDGLGIGYPVLAIRNPRLVYCQITPFGDRGPGASWGAADITSWAAGGMMFLTGSPDRPPLQLSVPQAGLNAGVEAAVASLLAHFARERDGVGQKVVVDTQACVVWTLMNEPAYPLLHGDYMRRNGVFSGQAAAARKQVYRCSDGQVTLLLGGNASTAASTRLLVTWMDEAGMAPPWLRDMDWARWGVGSDAESVAVVRRTEEAVEAFFMSKSKKELYDGALQRRLLLAPVNSVKEAAEDEQLAAHDFFRTVHHEHLGRDLVLPGPFAIFSETPIGSGRPAPGLGEHNTEVYGELLGYSSKRLTYLYGAGVI